MLADRSAEKSEAVAPADSRTFALKLNTELDADDLRARLKTWEPWGQLIEFSNGVSTAEFTQHRPFNPNPLQKLEAVRGKIPFELLRRGALLDVGCSTGYNALQCAIEYDMRVLGIDLSPRSIRVARLLNDLANARARYKVEDAEAFSRPESFDVILHFGTLYQLRDPLASLRKTCENLKSGGWLALETQVYDHPEDAGICYLMPMRGGAKADRWALSTAVLSRCLRSVGFELVEEVVRVQPAGLGPRMSRMTLVARKADGRSKHAHLRAPAPQASQTAKNMPAQLVALLGLPRSGTTILAAMLSAHPDVHMVFEPWNATKAKPRPMNLGVAAFIDAFDIDLAGKRVLAIKETAQQSYVDAIKNVLSDAAARMPANLVWIYRNPLHMYLSHSQAMREWWGHPEHALTADTFDQWAAASMHRLRSVLDALSLFSGVCVSYEALASNPADTMRRLLDQIGLSQADEVLDYHRNRRRPKPRGDRRVRDTPKPISPQSVEEREQELRAHLSAIEGARFMPMMKRLCDWGEKLAEVGVMPADKQVMGEVADILRAATMTAGER
jgi:SAM-dependent methyltransferase